jgi:N-acetylglucosamine-6-phosphate deacetylase
MLIAGAGVVTPEEVLEPGWLQVDDRTISAVASGEPPGPVDVDLADSWVVPGFVDIHVHGAAGASFGDGGATMRDIVDLHRAHGTTTMLASLVSAPMEVLRRQVQHLAGVMGEGGVVGVHLEGPYLSPERAGAHNRRHLRSPDLDDLARLVDLAEGSLRMVTLAPELPGAPEAIRMLARENIVAAIGHTDADYDCARRAVDDGARAATHLFNGMPPLAHRAPGAVGALLGDERVTVELINDGVHLHPEIVRLVATVAGPARIAMVTDAMSATGLGDGRYLLGDQEVEVESGTVRLAEGSSLAGSTLTMDRAFRGLVHGLGLPMAEAATMTAATPARLLGLGHERGQLRTGHRADLVVLTPDLEVERVMVEGRWAR